jgi:hypothetical protein
MHTLKTHAQRLVTEEIEMLKVVSYLMNRNNDGRSL